MGAGGIPGKCLFLILLWSLVAEASMISTSRVRRSIQKLRSVCKFSRSLEIMFTRKGVFQITNKPNSIELIFFKDVEHDETEENLRIMELPSIDVACPVEIQTEKGSKLSTTELNRLQLSSSEEKIEKEYPTSHLIEGKNRGSYYIFFHNIPNAHQDLSGVMLTFSIPTNLNNLTETERKKEVLQTEESQILCLWRIWEEYSKYYSMCGRYLVFCKEKPTSKHRLYIQKGGKKQADMAFLNGTRLFITGSNPLTVIDNFLFVKLEKDENAEEAEASIQKEEEENRKFCLALRIMKYRIRNVVKIEQKPEIEPDK